MSVTFLGIDLAWQSEKNHSGLVAMRGDTNGAEIVGFSTGIATLPDVVDYTLSYTTPNTVVAIDAPLIIKNQRDQRPCEKAISQKFGRYHASAHSSNLTLYPDPGSVKLARLLEQKGFLHEPNPARDKHKGGRWFFEVYPHPAQVVLFNLPKIIRYKKGRVAEKRQGLDTLRSYIKQKFVAGNPPIRRNEKFEALLKQDLEVLKGKLLKYYEDTLDALVCAYLALYYWTWGDEKNEMIGDLETGYIINPTEAL